MKKTAIIVLILFITAVFSAGAQDIFDARLLEAAGMSDGEISDIQDILYQAEQKTREANAEMNILKAQLEKMLLDENPDMNRVRETIEATIRWRVQSEIAHVEARVKIRKMMGSERWEKLLKLRKQMQADNRDLPDPGNPQDRPSNRGNSTEPPVFRN